MKDPAHGPESVRAGAVVWLRSQEENFVLENIADSLWVQSRHLRFWGLKTGTRTSVVRLAHGGLFVHSPVELTDVTKREVDGLGPVSAIVAPSRMHHLYVGQWMTAYPDAVVCCCPTLERKRADIPWQRILGDEPEPEWRSEIDQVFFGARANRPHACLGFRPHRARARRHHRERRP